MLREARTEHSGAAWLMRAFCMFSIEEKICRNGQTSILGTVGRMLSRSQRAFPTRFARGKGEVVATPKVPPLQRYLWARNAPYSLNDLDNPLKSQEMRTPWQNGFAERLIGSIRRECVDHIIVLGEMHLRRILRSYAHYYNDIRTHRSLDKDAPV
jgi:hypothetical protein